MSREGLVPKQITDKNGKRTTVHVREGDVKGGNASKLKTAGVKATPTKMSRAEQEKKVIECAKGGEGYALYEGKPDPNTGATPVALVQPQLGAEEGMMFAGIRTSRGEVVTMMDRGGEVDVDLLDEGSTKSFYSPVDDNLDDVEVTSAEFNQLMKLNEEFLDMEDELYDAEEGGDVRPKDDPDWRFRNASSVVFDKMEERNYSFSEKRKYGPDR